MSDDLPEYGDPLSRPFWEAAAEHRLLVQRCADCGRHQLYARPFCLGCESANLQWAESAGVGTVYSAVTVRVKMLPDLEPPYTVAIIELDEGPRLTADIVGGEAPIGSRVQVAWREREGLPPFPAFSPSSSL